MMIIHTYAKKSYIKRAYRLILSDKYKRARTLRLSEETKRKSRIVNQCRIIVIIPTAKFFTFSSFFSAIVS